jgi:alcohol dehydrogenase (cytochrome c)
LVSPDEGGATNWRPPSFDPKTGLFIVSSDDSYGVYFYKPEDGAYGWAGADYGILDIGALRAIDYQTGKIRWSHPLGNGSGAGVLTTDSGLTFTGDAARSFIALRTSDGSTLWHSSIGHLDNAPVTYLLDGRQYVLASSGGVLFAWALPDKPH